MGLVRGVRSRHWRALLLLVPALACAWLASLPVPYLLGLGAPHAVFNRPAPVSDTAVVFYSTHPSACDTHPAPPALIAVQASTGKTLWQRTMPGPYNTQDGRAEYVVSSSPGATRIVALEGATGNLLWQHALPETTTWGQPLLTGGLLVLEGFTLRSAPPQPQILERQIVAFRPADGQQLWSVMVGPFAPPSSRICCN